jgi:hypothetical protein
MAKILPSTTLLERPNLAAGMSVFRVQPSSAARLIGVMLIIPNATILRTFPELIPMILLILW